MSWKLQHSAASGRSDWDLRLLGSPTHSHWWSCPEPADSLDVPVKYNVPEHHPGWVMFQMAQLPLGFHGCVARLCGVCRAAVGLQCWLPVWCTEGLEMMVT